MPSDDQIVRAIDKIYDAALEPARWTELLRMIGELVGAPQGSLLLCSISKKTMTNFGYGRNDEAIALYNSRFLGEDPWYGPLAKLGVGVVATGQELCPTKTFEDSAVYQECMKLDEVYDCLGLLLENGRDLNAVIAFQRPESLPVFGAEEKKIFRSLVPHLQRLVRIHRKFESLTTLAAHGEDALNSLSFGVIILSGRSVQFANHAAEEIAICDDGLHLSSRGLVAHHADDNRALVDAYKLASRPRLCNSSGPQGSTVIVRRPSLKRPYSVQIMPLSERAHGSILGESNAACLATITDPTAARAPAAEALVLAYGLTPSEAELALKIGQGYSLKEAAYQLSISENTGRWHLKNVLAKTDACRQSELVTLLMQMAPPLRHRGQRE